MTNNANTEPASSLNEALSAAFGDRKEKKIEKQIHEFKAKHPNKAFTFIFDEKGNFKVHNNFNTNTS